MEIVEGTRIHIESPNKGMIDVIDLIVVSAYMGSIVAENKETKRKYATYFNQLSNNKCG